VLGSLWFERNTYSYTYIKAFLLGTDPQATHRGGKAQGDNHGGLLQDDMFSNHLTSYGNNPDGTVNKKMADDMFRRLNRNLQASDPGRELVKRMVVAHCIQSNRKPNTGYIPMGGVHLGRARNFMDYHARGLFRPIQNAHPMAMTAINSGTGRKVNDVWRIDIGMSRAFVGKSLQRNPRQRPAILIMRSGADCTVRQSLDDLPLD
jgi:hypothetical protein